MSDRTQRYKMQYEFRYVVPSTMYIIAICYSFRNARADSSPPRTPKPVWVSL